MDRNFDDLAQRFSQTIYQSPRGAFRLAALKQDFAELILPDQPSHALDLGAGQGQFALYLAQQGMQMSICDHSNAMLHVATEQFQQAQQPLNAYLCRLQQIDEHAPKRFPLVLNHAVLEWLEDPISALNIMLNKVAMHGWFSLMCYQQAGHVWRQLMNGRLHDPTGSNTRLKQTGNAPKHSFERSQLVAHIQAQGFTLKRVRGIRCVYDHMHEKIRQKMDINTLLQADLDYGLQEPYRSLGRYMHLVFKRSV